MAIYLPIERYDPWKGLRGGLEKAIQGWQIGRERRAQQADMTLVGRALEQAALNPENVPTLIRENMGRMQTDAGRTMLHSILSPYLEKERKYVLGPEQKLVTGAGEEIARGVPKKIKPIKQWGKLIKAGKDDPYFPENFVYQKEETTGDVQIHHAPTPVGVGKSRKDLTTHYMNQIKMIYGRHGPAVPSYLAGAEATPEGRQELFAYFMTKRPSMFQEIKKKARMGNNEAITDLAKLNYYFKQLDRLGGIGSPAFKRTLKETAEDVLITHEYDPKKGLIPKR